MAIEFDGKYADPNFEPKRCFMKNSRRVVYSIFYCSSLLLLQNCGALKKSKSEKRVPESSDEVVPPVDSQDPPDASQNLPGGVKSSD